MFAKVKLGPHGAIDWLGELDLCPAALYLRLTGKRPEEVFERLAPLAEVHSRSVLPPVHTRP